ncbi:MAG TPA: hypothetical protein VMN76_02800 [Acidobacteriota bacterium]|nr:hypothetical protein [Acidobacteriota bacterium]
MTYPQEKISEAISRFSVPVQFNTAEPTDEIQRRAKEFRQIWTPTFIWLTPDGFELRRKIGYFPAEELRAEFDMARGFAAYVQKDYEKAAQLFASVEKEFSDVPAASEGLYWAGVAELLNGSKQGLMKNWKKLQHNYSDSEWWTRASFIAG